VYGFRQGQPRRRCSALEGLTQVLPFVELAFADIAYNADRVRAATCIAIEVVKKIADQVGFRVLPRRWVVECFSAWISRNRCLAKDFEATVAFAEALLYAASVMLLTRRLTRAS
jgi:transposase